MNKVIRVCVKKQDEFGTVALSQASLIIFFNEDNTFAYGVAIKNQGGGQYGDYHIIGYNTGNNSWKFNVGNFKPFDGFYDEYTNTGSGFPDFDIEEAKKYFDDSGADSLYDLYNKFNRTVDSDGIIEEHFSEKDKKTFGFDNLEYPGYPDESGEYYSSKLCLLDDLEGAEESGGFLWYSLNNCDEDLLNKIESDNIIQTISKMIAGNIDFIK